MNHKILYFLIPTFLLTSFIGAWLYMFREQNSPIINTMVIPVLYMMVPMIVAIVVQKFIYHQPLKIPLRISFRVNRWFFAAWLLPVFLSIAVFGFSLFLPGVTYAPNMEGLFDSFKASMSVEQIEQSKQQMDSLPLHPFWLSILSALIAGITINAIAGFGEELGWRGLLLREWEHLGFWRCSVYIGLIWGIWHAPIILQGHNYPQYPVIGTFLMVIWCMLLSPLFTWITLKSNSVIAASILHGTFNASAGLATLMIQGGNDLLTGVTGLAGMIVLFIVNIILYLLVRNDPNMISNKEMTNA